MSRAQVWVAAGDWSGELDGTSARGSDGESLLTRLCFPGGRHEGPPSCRRGSESGSLRGYTNFIFSLNINEKLLFSKLCSLLLKYVLTHIESSIIRVIRRQKPSSEGITLL